MSENILNARLRTASGKGGARQTRAQGMIPGVYYGHNETTIHLAVNAIELGRLMRSRHTILMLNIDKDEPRQCIIRAIQRDPVNASYLHIDLLAVHKGEKITISIPVKLSGTPIGVKESGGILEHGLVELSIECEPANIPEQIEVDVTGMQLGQSIHVSDISFADVRLLDDPNAIVAHIAAPKVEKAPTAEEGSVAEGAEAAAEVEPKG